MVRNVFTDTVEHHHGIVDGVTDHRKDSCDEGLVDLHGERHDLPQQGVNTQNDDRIVEQGDKTSETILPVAETHSYVCEDAQQRKAESRDRGDLDVVTD